MKQNGCDESSRPRVEHGFSLKRKTWFGTASIAEYYAEPQTISELRSLRQWASRLSLEVRVLGEGANVLCRDGLLPGLTLKLTGDYFSAVEIREGWVVCGAGAKLGTLIGRCIRGGLGGIEHLAGIPATIGGAVVCNAGGRSGDVFQWLRSVHVMKEDGEIVEAPRSDIEFDYRRTSLVGRIVTKVTLSLPSGDKDFLAKKYREALSAKKSSQPLTSNSAGCMFKNPRGISARELIAKSGMSGFRVNKAFVSDLHANFVCVEDGVSSNDILRLIDAVRFEVENVFGVQMETEVQIW